MKNIDINKVEAELHEAIHAVLLENLNHREGEKGGIVSFLAWKLSDGTLTISGKGALPDFSAKNKPPWYDDHDHIHNVVIENGVTNIGACAFGSTYERAHESYHNLKSVDIASTVTDIDSYAFCRSPLESVIIPDSEKSIGSKAFFRGSFKTLIIPDSVINIGDNAFTHCEDLEELTIGASVKTIGERAFYSCKRLANVHIKTSVPPKLIISYSKTGIPLSTFDMCPIKEATLTVPKGSKAAYLSAAGWKDFGNIAETA
jgi:hypothetical protein